MRSRLAFFGSVALALALALTVSTTARADTHGDAVKAFEEGRKLRDANDLDKAVRAFERSLSLEPSIGAYYNLGLINDQLERPREAVDAFRKAEQLAREKGDAREKDAADARTKVLETRNHVVLNVADDVASTPGLRLLLDGEVVPPAQYNGEVFRAPASHELVVSATGRKELHLPARNRQPVEVKLGEKVRVVTLPAAPPPDAPSTGGWGWQKWSGAGLVGVGVAGIAVSLVRVFTYLGDESRLDDARRAAREGCIGGNGTITTCDGSTSSPRIGPANEALRAYDENERDAKDAAPLTVAFGVGGLLLVGGGIALFATAPASSASSEASTARVRVVPRVGVRETGLAVVGRF